MKVVGRNCSRPLSATAAATTASEQDQRVRVQTSERRQRVDNVCKRVLDDVAVRLQNEPKGSVVIIGYADPKERHSDRLATQRGENVKKYPDQDKGIDQSRITVRQGSGQEGAKAANRRVEIIWVPGGGPGT